MALHEWIEELLEVGDPQLPQIATWAAERTDIDLLVRLMDDYIVHCNVRTVEAIKATLPSIGEALTKRIASMLEHQAPEERRAGALFAGLLGLQTLAPRLVAALDDSYFLTRMEAATALGRLRYLPATEQLRLALGDDDTLTPGAAIEALTVIPDPDLLTAYTGVITVDPPVFYRGAFDHANPRARAHAISVLGKYQPPCAREALSFYLREFEELAEDELSESEVAEEKKVLELARSVLAELR
ncbi:MAG: HEAT repeat domain-containing protein [Polyangiaceae bacterium]|nr:HEAT repeat domain-containing protein [Polyangiaceae bacterium]